MEEIRSFLAIVLFVIVAVGSAVELNLKKWWSWFFIMSSFLLGFAFSFDVDRSRLVFFSGLRWGTVIASIVIFSSWAMTRRRKKLNELENKIAERRSKDNI